MKLYKTTAEFEGDSNLVRWSGSQADAAGVRKHFNSELGAKRNQITTDIVDVPTDKQGLLAFLNGEKP